MEEKLNDSLTVAGSALVIVLGALLVYTVLPSRTLQWLLSIASFALTLFVIYLFYRLVIAVEKIAAKL
ncbi:uncharacterized protein Nmag_1426 [Natrialba magadii ATCC 43099]|uniref:Uncharacterized protein n=1 Tax=Natrialba magadii (strain ATCC 43099 / DSM 3394 / CCM 3739 / CIP 104546 / IAM 13178 / JCM 8861 / NBRC 102185 / NCIMB 2190 / MS3) TaxID=547559 RepID=D3STI8_NATMM|nr:hypothetical protein [Natrialba magadii]ADD05005.1 uncharacterized protein Nmag_1426 [Natrialba magadii ATCC 43099]ELY24051.1 hypothetical protein C500_19645 [Natrialba magadii ATCC 43099]